MMLLAVGAVLLTLGAVLYGVVDVQTPQWQSNQPYEVQGLLLMVMGGLLLFLGVILLLLSKEGSFGVSFNQALSSKWSWLFVSIVTILVVVTVLVAEFAVDPWFMVQTEEGAEAVVWSGGYEVGDFVQYQYLERHASLMETSGTWTYTIVLVNPDNFTAEIVDSNYPNPYRFWNVTKDLQQQYGYFIDITSVSDEIYVDVPGMRFLGNQTVDTEWGALDCAHFKGVTVHYLDLQRDSLEVWIYQGVLIRSIRSDPKDSMVVYSSWELSATNLHDIVQRG